MQREGTPSAAPGDRHLSSVLPEEPVLLGPPPTGAVSPGRKEGGGRGRLRQLGLGWGSWTSEPPGGPSASGSHTSGLGFSGGSHTVTLAHTFRGTAGCGKPGRPTYSAIG